MTLVPILSTMPSSLVIVSLTVHAVGLQISFFQHVMQSSSTVILTSFQTTAMNKNAAKASPEPSKKA